MSWHITDAQNQRTTVRALQAGNPVAYDESGFAVDLDDLLTDPEMVADAGYFGRDQRRILIWGSEEDAENDPGDRAIASAVWID